MCGLEDKYLLYIYMDTPLSSLSSLDPPYSTYTTYGALPCGVGRRFLRGSRALDKGVRWPMRMVRANLVGDTCVGADREPPSCRATFEGSHNRNDPRLQDTNLAHGRQKRGGMIESVMVGVRFQRRSRSPSPHRYLCGSAGLSHVKRPPDTRIPLGPSRSSTCCS